LDPRFEINEHPLRFTPRLIERQSVRNITD